MHLEQTSYMKPWYSFLHFRGHCHYQLHIPDSYSDECGKNTLFWGNISKSVVGISFLLSSRLKIIYRILALFKGGVKLNPFGMLVTIWPIVPAMDVR
jgi:hypothetical protein